MARTQNGNFIAESGQNYTFGDSTTQSSAAYTKSESDALYLGITDTAADSSKLNNQSASYYLNATNINSGTLSAARLPDTYIPTSQKGAASGVCPLDGSGLVDSSYLPSYVDDVEEYADYASLPGTGETGKIYTTLDTNLIYRWSGSAYVQINSSISEADTLDGLHAASFLRSDADDTASGKITHTDNIIIQTNNGTAAKELLFDNKTTGVYDFGLYVPNDNSGFTIEAYKTNNKLVFNNDGDTLTIAGNTIWNAGNLAFGSGSGDMCEGDDSRLSDARTPVSHNNTYHSEIYITTDGVTFEALNNNSDVGTGASQVAAGNHTHSGTYEPADATILKQADVDDTPIDAATTVPVSSNWAYDHAARFKAGVKSISDASNTVTVDFTTEGLTDYAGTDYSINPVIENTTDGTPGGYNLDITAKSATGFTIKLSGLTDSANYKLDWFTYYYG